MREKIKKLLHDFIPEDAKIEISVPELEANGHYSTNVAFLLSKERKQPPMVVAESLAKRVLETAPAGFFKRVSAASPGFLNFWIADGAWQEELGAILKMKNKYGRVTPRGTRGEFAKKRIQVEYVSANPTGPLTLANGRGGFFGDVLSNVLKWTGHGVEGEYYVNDTGNQILTLGKSLLAVLGVLPDDENFYRGGYIAEWAKKNRRIVLAHKGKPLKLGKRAAKDFLKSIKTTLEKKAGIKFDRWTSEDKHIYKKNFVKKAREIFERKGFAYSKEGALWLKTAELGDDKDRVIVTSDGSPTYFLADAGHYLETKKRGFDAKINILGPDHYGYVARIQAAAKILDLPDSRVIITQAVRLTGGGEEGKMSKRKGVFTTFEELVKEVGRDAARFFFLMHSVGSHMDFDLALAKERSQKNPVYYAQYAYVRAASILRKLTTNNRRPITKKLNSLNTKEDLALIRLLARLPEVLRDIAEDYQVHHLTRYALELARAFHNFYERERIIGEKNADLAKARLALVLATKQIFEDLFKVLGISAPRKM